MKELSSISEKYKEIYPDICTEIEIFIAKQEIFNFLNSTEYTRIFPKNGSHYVDLYWDDDHDERVYVAFKYLYELGLMNYIEKMYEHEAVLLLVIRKDLYTIKEVKESFKEIIGKECIDVCSDIWNYEIVKDL